MAPSGKDRTDTTTSNNQGKDKHSSRATISSVSGLPRGTSPLKTSATPAKAKKTSLLELVGKQQVFESLDSDKCVGKSMALTQARQQVSTADVTSKRVERAEGDDCGLAQHSVEQTRVTLPPLIPPGTKDITPLVEAMNSMYALLSSSQHLLRGANLTLA